MAYSGLSEFISDLDDQSELHRIKTFVDPVLEITEITDRITKNNGKALLFENTGTAFPLLINAFSSDKRIQMALGIKSLEETADEIFELFNRLTGMPGTISGKLKNIPALIKIAGLLPVRLNRRGSCQQVIHRDPDLSSLPVLKCWPFDGGRFITLPMVHTLHPLTGKTNLGMYRMQILNQNTTAMHWQMHKTGAVHFEAWKREGKIMPVSVALGGDPVYTYAATAPLPENIDEYILAGFLRKKRVSLVKCITNDLYVPNDADIVIEGYVDPSEELVREGPFGDHTGFYSLDDLYPRFHVTCLTHSKKAVYPATIVGIPPQEDAWLAKATERIFLAPLKLALQPEIEDFHLPDAGVAHNLAIVKINKSYPGQGRKVINSLSGAGQMMFTKYMVVVSGEVDIRNYRDLILHILENTDFNRDVLFNSGPLDVLDHSSDTFSYGGKAGIDGTIKLPEEIAGNKNLTPITGNRTGKTESHPVEELFSEADMLYHAPGLPLLIAGLNQSEDNNSVESFLKRIEGNSQANNIRMVLVVDSSVDVTELFDVAWQVLGNSDPLRDIKLVFPGTLFIDGTPKAFRKGGFPRRWPNVVCSDRATIEKIDAIWETLQTGPFIQSPSTKFSELTRGESADVIISY
jgi:4-hydroxy-3-polyprenylbenzoate decarboxylase